MKNGLVFENDWLFYYKDDNLYHAGIIEENGDIYYIGSNGRAVKGMHVVHKEMSNGILAHGTYTFGDDFKLIKDSYIPPKKYKSNKRKHSKNKNKNKNRLSRSHKFNFAVICCATLAMVILCVLAGYLGTKTMEKDKTDTSASNDIVVTLPSFDSEVLLCTDEAKKLYDGECSITEALQGGNPYRPFVFNYSIKGADGTLILSDDPSLSNSRSYLLSSKNTSIYINNLKTATVYYYKVTVADKEYTGSFKTAASTRFIYIPGVYNTRDIGGYKTLDNKTVKQGYIIRGSEIDGLVENTYYLSTENIESVRNEFGFVYDLDLREGSLLQTNYKSRLGADVRHDFYSAPAYGQVFNMQYKQSIKDTFSAMADPNNYPMYLHCTYGADRTGTIVFLLQGILNMSEEDILTEYQRTAFKTSSYATNDYMEIVISSLDSFEGDTLGERIENYLIDNIGVTKEEIASIRSILLED